MHRAPRPAESRGTPGAIGPQPRHRTHPGGRQRHTRRRPGDRTLPRLAPWAWRATIPPTTGRGRLPGDRRQRTAGNRTTWGPSVDGTACNRLGGGRTQPAGTTGNRGRGRRGGFDSPGPLQHARHQADARRLVDDPPATSPTWSMRPGGMEAGRQCTANATQPRPPPQPRHHRTPQHTSRTTAAGPKPADPESKPERTPNPLPGNDFRPRPLAAVYAGPLPAPPRICCRRCSAVLAVASSLSLGSPLSPPSLREGVVNPTPGYFPPFKCHMAR
jgi:hypothetical protein